MNYQWFLFLLSNRGLVESCLSCLSYLYKKKREVIALIKTNKKISLLMVLTMIVTMFFGLGTASAALITYEVSTANILSADSNTYQQLGKVSIDIKDIRVIPEEGEWLNIELPNNCEYDGVIGGDAEQAGLIIKYNNLQEVSSQKTAANSIEIKVKADPLADESEGNIFLDFKRIKVKSGTGDIDVQFSGTGIFAQMEPAEVAVVGEGKGNLTVEVSNAKKIGENGGYTDSITIIESQAKTLKEGDAITFKLPAGYSWGNSNYIVAAGSWAFEGYHGMGTAGDFSFNVSGRDLILSINNLPDNAGSAGKITIGTDSLSSIYPLGGYPFIEVDDGTAPGNIVLKVTASNPNIKINDLKAASFDDYGITLESADIAEVMAGRTDQKLGEFIIEEEVRSSLKNGQTIYFNLPEGVKWIDYGSIEIDGTSVINENNYSLVSGSDGRKIKNTFSATSSEVTRLTFKDMKVSIEPWFAGPLEIMVSGTVDVGGKVTVAEVIQPVMISVEGLTNVVVGAMNQKAGDIIITESESGAIMGKAGNDQIFITLPKGVSFAGTPRAEVIAGDLDLGEVKIGSTGVATVDDGLLIKITADSSEKSVIKISDIYLTLDRTVPEGVVKAKLEGIKDFGWAKGSTALIDFAASASMANADIAKTVTPSMSGTASFKIGSSTYQVGGVSQIMDVAPYIKDDRSFVPVRYLGENMLGATVAWNEGEQEVVLTRGGIELVLTIGSKTYTVNGVERTADVAPEIVNSRTFLPARYVAEAFGATVGWDAATYTVTIQR